MRKVFLQRLTQLLAGSFLLGAFAHAGYIELSATGNYRISRIDDDNYQELISYTGSIAYYFWEMSALELSYTEGKQVASIRPIAGNQTVTTSLFSLAGLDLVLTLAGKQSMFQPFVKFGGAYVKKEIVTETIGLGTVQSAPTSSGLTPSAGVGFRIRLTQTFSIKVGVDAWTSPSDQAKKTVDYAGRAGVSWMF